LYFLATNSDFQVYLTDSEEIPVDLIHKTKSLLTRPYQEISDPECFIRCLSTYIEKLKQMLEDRKDLMERCNCHVDAKDVSVLME